MLSFMETFVEEVYMDISPGYVSSSNIGIVCRLQRALYGQKKSPHAWFDNFNIAMKKYGIQKEQLR